MKQDDPVSQGAARAIEHLNDDHADALLEMRRRSAASPRPAPPAASTPTAPALT